MKFRYIFWVIRFQSLQKCFARIFTIFVCKNEAVCREVQAHFGGFHFASKKILGAFSRFLRAKTRYLPWSSDAFWKFSACKFYRKSSGRNFTSCASENKAVCCEVQTHFGSPLPCKVYKKSSGRIFSIFSSESEAVCRWVPTYSGLSPLARFAVKSCGRNFMIYVSKKNEAVCCWCSDAFWKFSPCEIDEKFWAHFHDLCVQKRSCFLWSSDAFWTFSTCKFYRKGSGHNFTICASKN